MASFTADDDWIRCVSNSNGKEYWFHSRSGKSIWCDPRKVNPDDKVAIIVPFRDLHKDQQRSAHLKNFIPEMTSFLEQGGIPFKIFIIEQSNDGLKFNRGKLLNVGYVLAALEYYTIFIFHDVDLIPSIELLDWYTQRPLDSPFHIAKVWERYTKNEKYFGGIVAFSKELYEQINGYPNNYWGWGGEDDEMYNRVQKCNMKILYPQSGSIRDMEEKSLHEKLHFLKEHELWKCMNKNELLREHASTWRSNGLAQFQQKLEFLVIQEEHLSDYCVKITVQLALNNHWSDEKCKESDKQY